MSEILTDHSGLDKYQKLLRATPELPILLVSANSKQAPAESIGSPLEGSLPGALLLFPLNFILGRTRCGQGGLNGKSEDLQDEEEFLSPKEGIMIGSRQGTNDRSRAWVTDQAGAVFAQQTADVGGRVGTSRPAQACLLEVSGWRKLSPLGASHGLSPSTRPLVGQKSAKTVL